MRALLVGLVVFLAAVGALAPGLDGFEHTTALVIGCAAGVAITFLRGAPDIRARASLLKVGLNLVFGALVSVVRVVAELALGAALAQQVPALVQVLLDVREPAAVLVGRLGLGAKFMLLGNELIDVAEDLLVVHCGSSPFVMTRFL